MKASFQFHDAKVTGIMNYDGTEPQITSIDFHGVNILPWLEAEPDLNSLILDHLYNKLQEEKWRI